MTQLTTLNSLYPLTPLVLAHRGASHDAPENTVAAFSLARTLGADGIELDTSLTRDGVPVVVHDLMLDKTTSGSGPIRNYTLKEIKALDAGSHHSAQFKGEQVPTLDEAFEAIGPSLIVNVELKAADWRNVGLESAVEQIIQRHNPARVIVSSFDPWALQRFRALAPDIAIGYLYFAADPYIHQRADWLAESVPHEALHPLHFLIDGPYMAWAKQHGYRVNTWTVDDPDRIVALRDLGVDAIISNRPDVALKALGRG